LHSRWLIALVLIAAAGCGGRELRLPGVQLTIPRERVRLYFDGRPWAVADKVDTPAGAGVDYLLPGQTMKDWRELIAWRVSYDAQKNTTPYKLADRLRAQLAKTYSTLEWNVISFTRREVVFEWWHGTEGDEPARHTLGRLIATRQGMHHFAYSARSGKLPADTRGAWLRVLGAARVYRRTDIEPKKSRQD
jgi:hypothetical protein